jgi:photosystem II stability/assembly factor-like uncharacterized protein
MRGFVFLLVMVTVAFPLDGQEYGEALYDALSWTNVGPARGGRSQAVAGSATRPLEYFFGAAGGGLWKTTDGGQTWEPVTDGLIGSSSIGAVAVCEADPDVVYIGTGETELRGNVQQGDGLYKSSDGGLTWAHIGLTEAQNFSRVRVHPTDCNIVWTAAFGKHSKANRERGIYKSTDGGISWRMVLNRPDNEWTGGVDLSVDPNNPDVLYAALWEAWRKSWGMSSGGTGGGLFRSTDGGETWDELTGSKEGLPGGVLGKIGVAISPANPDRVWALIEHPEGGVFRTDDGGETWTRTNEERKLLQRAFYYARIYADPIDENTVYALNTGLYKSTDGGETFPTQIRVPHGDNHDLWISPDDPMRIANANDGGANVSVNGGGSWTDQDFSTAQFYRVITTAHEPYHICGAQQDNSTACLSTQGWGHLSASGPLFYSVGGCESGYIAPHPRDTDIFYAGCYGGSLSRFDRSTGQRRQINVWPENPMGQSAEDLRERVQWTFPIVFDHMDSNVLYTGTHKVWRTTDEGQSWEAISPDLTRADPETIGPSGGPITKDQTGVETYATIFALAPSYHDSNVIWAGSDDGYVHVTRNAGRSWDNVTPPDAPDFVRINTIEASPIVPGKAFVAGIRYLVDDDRNPYVWRTEDYGQTWTKIVDGIGDGDFVRAVREDPTRAGLLYAASQETVYVSWDDGSHWQSLALNLPVVEVSDLVVEEDDLVIGTHGRSFWVLRNIEPLRQMTDEVATAAAYLFRPKDPVRSVDQGVEVYYTLQEDVDRVAIEFLDGTGGVIRSFENIREEETEEQEDTTASAAGPGPRNRDPVPSLEAGSHRLTWNLRHEGYTDFEGRIFWAAGNNGPITAPGDYRVRLRVEGRAQERDFTVRIDPRLVDQVSIGDLQERFELAMDVRDRVSEANEAVLRVRDIKSSIDDRVEDSENLELKSLGATVKDRLAAVEGEIYQVRNESNQDPLNFPIKLNNKLASLLGIIESAEARPTAQVYEVFEMLSGQLDTELQQLTLIIQQDLARLNELLRSLGMDPIESQQIITE